jgi:hypothetical protein
LPATRVQHVHAQRALLIRAAFEITSADISRHACRRAPTIKNGTRRRDRLNAAPPSAAGRDRSR